MSTKKEIKIHYNPYANDSLIDKRLPKTICGQKNNGNETHIKDEVTCFVCKRMFNNVDRFMNGGLQEMLDHENKIKQMSFEELENFEHICMGWELYNKPLTKKEIKMAEIEFNKFLREVYGPDAGPDEDVYIFDGIYITSDNEIEVGD